MKKPSDQIAEYPKYKEKGGSEWIEVGVYAQVSNLTSQLELITTDFPYGMNISHVHIPEGVESIFLTTALIDHIEFPSTIKHFHIVNTPNLKEIEIPKGVEHVAIGYRIEILDLDEVLKREHPPDIRLY